ncbi:MAG: hypothetical protein ACOCQY_03750 [Halorhabdus sp.]
MRDHDRQRVPVFGVEWSRPLDVFDEGDGLEIVGERAMMAGAFRGAGLTAPLVDVG